MKPTKDQKDLLKIIALISSDVILLDGFLTDLLTPAEYTEIVKRWEIVKMLHNNMNQHEIAKKLSVGIATVTRGARVLKDSKKGFQRVLKNLEK